MKSLLAFLLVAGSACFGAEVKLGKPLTIKENTSIAAIYADSDRYVGKFIQVKGKVSQVCQQMGCWMILTDPASGQAVRIKGEDGDIVFPKDAAGKTAIAEGKLLKLVLTREQAITRARHESEESGKPFDPGSIRNGVTVYQIQGTSVVLLD